MKFQDYYQTLGLERNASKEQISKAYRKLARKFHPDVNKEAGAEDNFKRLTEAYEVLKDPEKRKLYDTLGENWKSGQDFTPPPDWAEMFGGAGRQRAGRGAKHYSFNFGQAGGGSGGQGGGRPFTAEDFTTGDSGFSDFFNAFFGGDPSDKGHTGARSQNRTQSRGPKRTRPASPALQSEIQVSLEEVVHQAKKTVEFQFVEPDEHGLPRTRQKKLEIKLPRGLVDGKVIRLSGQGGKGPIGEDSRDLLVKICFAPHAQFRAEGSTIRTNLPISPWEAALGSRVALPTLDGTVQVRIPPGSQSGQQLRLQGRGLPLKEEGRGDFFAELKIVVPKELSSEEKSLFEALASKSTFNPRGISVRA